MVNDNATAISTVAELVAIIGNRRKPCGKIATVVHSLTDGNIPVPVNRYGKSDVEIQADIQAEASRQAFIAESDAISLASFPPEPPLGSPLIDRDPSTN